MIYEKLNLSLDGTKLRKQLEEQVLTVPITMQGPNFGGWSLTSTGGHFSDDWTYGCFIVNGAYDLEKVKTSNKPTSLLRDYLKETIQKVSALGLNPLRCRISLLKANSKSVLHRDGADEQYMVRLHIPIVTNEGCAFLADGEAAHLPADGNGYLLSVNRMHQIVNTGSTDRYHLMMDVWDTEGASLHHRYSGSRTLFPNRMAGETT